jgi:putative NADH-flavin reductase
MKNIIVFGASGGTGLEVVEQALEAGHHVTAVLRNPEVFPIRHEQLKIIRGNVFNLQGYENAFFGKEVVISCLGTHKKEPTTVYSQGVTNIMQAMQKVGMDRIICLSSSGVEISSRVSFITKLIMKYSLQRIFKYIYADMLQMEKVLRESNLNWTVIRPPRLLDGDKTGKYRTSINGYLPNPSSLNRSDLAYYIIDHLDDEKTYKSRVEISY